MEFSIKLRNEQLDCLGKAVSRLFSWERYNDEDGNPLGELYYTGNVVGYMLKDPCSNTDVRMNIDNNVLTYKGQRCPFVHDGFLNLLTEVLGPVKNIKVYNYKTTDSRLQWYDTLESWVHREGTAAELLDHLMEKQYDLHDFWIKFPDVKKAFDGLLAGQLAKVSASFDVETVRLARVARKYLSDQGNWLI